jgi:putative FmdB family regulatory protein
MPIYEYACPDCGHKFDEIQKFTDDPISVCPKCAATNVKKLISATSFVLKGGGWYKDHYGLKSGGDSSASASDSSSSSTSVAVPSSAATASTPAAAPASSSSTPSTGSSTS